MQRPAGAEMADITTITPTIGVTIVKFTDNKIAEIVIDRAATAEHVLDAMDLARIMLAHGVTAAKIIKPKTRLSDDPGSKSSVT